MSAVPRGKDRELVTAGIDVGSAAVKVAIVRNPGEPGSERMLAGVVERMRRRDPLRVVDSALESALDQAKVRREQLDYVATTGEGELVAFRTGHFYGMTTHARGGLFLEPRARAVIDIGALHARAVMMDDRAKVLGYRMTNQCASGSGQFLENICRYLGVTIEEIGPLSLKSEKPETCSSICAVLAETDVINMVSRGIPIPDIIKGIHQSMAGRYLRLLLSLGVNGVVLVTGGLAQDQGLLQALRESCGPASTIEIVPHEHSALAGAIGASLWGAFRLRKLEKQGHSLAAGEA